MFTDYFVRCIPSNSNSKCVILCDFNLSLLAEVMCSFNIGVLVDSITQSFIQFFVHAGLLQHIIVPAIGDKLNLIFTYVNLQVNVFI